MSSIFNVLMSKFYICAVVGVIIEYNVEVSGSIFPKTLVPTCQNIHNIQP